MNSAKSLFTKAEQDKIIQAIREAEHQTSGEIRVHLENSCPGDVLDQAAYLFKKLDMHKTELRNGVLFYLAVKNKKFAVIGDAGINQKVPENFWEETKNIMQADFARGLFADGLANGIKQAGNQLKAHFPRQSDDTNELSDEISFGKN